MSRTRPSRAAARTLRLLLLASLVMLGPLAAAPSHAWTPPPAPLPIEPGDTDGQDWDDMELNRPADPVRAGRTTTVSDGARTARSEGARGGVERSWVATFLRWVVRSTRCGS